MEYLGTSIEDTNKLAEIIGKHLKSEDVILLDGHLGAGKTTFTKALAKNIGIEEVVNSPTFSIVNEYESARGNFYHFDLYRLEEEEELFDIGFEEYFSNEGIMIIEWAEKFIQEIPKPYLKIYINKKEEESRSFLITSEGGERWDDLLKELKEDVDSRL